MNTKQCFKCKQYKSLDLFYKHPQMEDGHLNKCKKCNKKDVQENYRKRIDQYREYERKRYKDPIRRAKTLIYNKKRNKRFPGKARARNILGNALRSGLIRKPDLCEKCLQKKNLQGHHLDYRKPLFVKWLCFQCHRKEHKQNPKY